MVGNGWTGGWKLLEVTGVKGKRGSRCNCIIRAVEGEAAVKKGVVGEWTRLLLV